MPYSSFAYGCRAIRAMSLRHTKDENGSLKVSINPTEYELNTNE